MANLDGYAGYPSNQLFGMGIRGDFVPTDASMGPFGRRVSGKLLPLNLCCALPRQQKRQSIILIHDSSSPRLQNSK